MHDEAQNQPIINSTGELIGLGSLRRDPIPLYNRWENDFEAQRIFGDLPKGRTIEATTDWFEGEARGTFAVWFAIYERFGDDLADGTFLFGCKPTSGVMSCLRNADRYRHGVPHLLAHRDGMCKR